MNFLFLVLAICVINIQSASIQKENEDISVKQKRFTQNFYAPVLNKDNIKELIWVNDKNEIVNKTGFHYKYQQRPRNTYLDYNKLKKNYKRGFNQEFHNVIHNQQNVDNTYRTGNNYLYGNRYMAELNVDKYGRIRRSLTNNGNIEDDRKKRGFNQNFNGNIYNQQNIENYHKQDYYGPIRNQANIDNSWGRYKRSFNQEYHNVIHNQQNVDNTHRKEKNYLYTNRNNVELSVDKCGRIRRTLANNEKEEGERKKRGFRQNFNGNIYNQQNIERYHKQDYYGPIGNQANIDNSWSRYKRGFNQQFNGNILNQQNIENYHKQDYHGKIDKQINVDNSVESENTHIKPINSVQQTSSHLANGKHANEPKESFHMNPFHSIKYWLK